MWLSRSPFRLSCFFPVLIFLAPHTATAVEVFPVESRVMPRERYLDAVIEAEHQATISAQTSGRIEKIHFDVDDYVAKGSVLIEFRARDQQSAFNAAQANYKQAEAEHKRIKDVYAQKLVARAVLDRAEAQFKAAKARLEQAQESLEHTVVRAPYSGIVVKRHIEVGENASVGQKLMTGLSLETLRAQVAIPQDMILAVRQVKKAALILPTGGRVQADSIRISASADPDSHTFDARIYLPKGDHGLYPGMFAKLAFVLGETNKLMVPKQAVVNRSEVSGVYVVDKEGKIHFRQVRVGRQLGEEVEILAGLIAGEQIARDPSQATVDLKASLEAH
ncbi:MAG: efflux RND transporter periplasmic adaptor subunit [Gammaproteobacteria bacterium]|nr:efflux RND transporter periplasmic adaptor subunit [Gammaproteobacteria bacterium]MDH5651102.1 efflux RND transporter periplasmic adaptor subunit [Gammaproteobacteria bacterium]